MNPFYIEEGRARICRSSTEKVVDYSNAAFLKVATRWKLPLGRIISATNKGKKDKFQQWRIGWRKKWNINQKLWIERTIEWTKTTGFRLDSGSWTRKRTYESETLILVTHRCASGDRSRRMSTEEACRSRHLGGKFLEQEPAGHLDRGFQKATRDFQSKSNPPNCLQEFSSNKKKSCLQGIQQAT